ncbi:Dual specificity protein phosphatase cdc14a [Phlyctochytrium planicorne]|nr:Dual specificity protein phosphatase cdc14a [Phlyctochytrium planicorne]
MPYSTSLFNHSISATPADVLANSREFIKNKLYFTSLSQTPPQYPTVHFFTIDHILVYINFYSDFGPSNLSHVVRFCEVVKEKFKNPLLQGKKLCLYSSMDSDKRANAAFLICAYMMIVQKKTPDEAYSPLIGISQPFLPYRDAGYGAATYHITILDCLRGLYKALHLGLVDLENVDPDEYEFYERVENGDFNWITDKFIAMASPKDDPPGMAQSGFGGVIPTGIVQQQQQQQQQHQGGLQQQRKVSTVSTTYTNASGILSRTVTPAAALQQQQQQQQQISGPQYNAQGKKSFNPAYRIDDLIRHLKERGVTTVVRLNNKIYERKKFTDAGLEHVELYFPDGSTPPDGILKRFLEICETRPGVIAVHCKAGLGRTGTLIGAYIMKHYKFTAAEVIGLLRVLRPGSVVGPQQNYLQSMQAKLWKMQPTAKLPQAISLLHTPTFPVSRRFPITDVYDIYTNDQQQQQLQSQQQKSSSRSTTPAPRPASAQSQRSTPSKRAPSAPMQLSSLDHIDQEFVLAPEPDASLDELMTDRSLQNLALDGPRPVTSGGQGSGFYQNLMESGRIESEYDPMDYEASGKLVDGDLPAQPRKHSHVNVGAGDANANASMIRRELLQNAMQGIQQGQGQQRQKSESSRSRPSSASTSSSHSSSYAQRPASASYISTSNPPTSSFSSQSRYQLRSSAISNGPYLSSNADRSRYAGGVVNPNDLSQFVLTGTGKPMTPASDSGIGAGGVAVKRSVRDQTLKICQKGMGAKGSKSRPSSPKKEESSAKEQVQGWKDTEFSKPAWNPISKLLALEPDHEVKKRLKAWCRQNEEAKKRKLGDILDCYDDITKRRVFFQSGQRCGDSKERGEEVLETNAQSLVKKYLTPSEPKDLTDVLGEDWKGDKIKQIVLTDSSCFDALQALLFQASSMIAAISCGLLIGLTAAWWLDSRHLPNPNPNPNLPKPEESTLKSTKPKTKKKRKALLFDVDVEDVDDSKNTVYKVLVAVRKDLAMKKGKMAAQASHGVVGVTMLAFENDEESLALWQSEGSKIDIRGIDSEKELISLHHAALNSNIITQIIEDEGRTQIAAGSLTVVGIGPGPSDEIDKIAGKLKPL